MIQLVTINIVRFVLLVALQILILNQVQLSGYLNPFLYVLFILLLPFEVSKWGLLVLAFVLGGTIDLLGHTPGMHMAACLFMAYCRPFVLAIIAPRGGYEVGSTPSVRDLGLTWFLTYAGALIFLHHLVLFFVEVFRFNEAHITIGRAFASTVFSLLLVVISQYITLRPRATT